MAEQVLERGDCYRIYTTDGVGQQVPYLPGRNIHGREDFGFVDLRDKPEAIARIPEAAGHPGFAVFLQAVNAPGSALMSLACSVELTPVRAGAAAPEGGEAPTHFIDSSVDIVARDFPLSTGDNMLGLARALMQLRNPQPGNWASYDMGILRYRSLFRVNNVIGLNIRLRALGVGEDAAWENFNFNWTQLAAAVRKLKIGTEVSPPTN